LNVTGGSAKMTEKEEHDQKIEKLKHRIRSLLEKGPAAKSDIYAVLKRSFGNAKA
jgi:hypothetical protein